MTFCPHVVSQLVPNLHRQAHRRVQQHAQVLVTVLERRLASEVLSYVSVESFDLTLPQTLKVPTENFAAFSSVLTDESQNFLRCTNSHRHYWVNFGFIFLFVFVRLVK